MPNRCWQSKVGLTRTFFPQLSTYSLLESLHAATAVEKGLSNSGALILSAPTRVPYADSLGTVWWELLLPVILDPLIPCVSQIKEVVVVLAPAVQALGS